MKEAGFGACGLPGKIVKWLLPTWHNQYSGQQRSKIVTTLLALPDHLLNPAISVQRLVKTKWQSLHDCPIVPPSSGARFSRNWRRSLATETAWFALDSAKDSGTSSLGGAIYRNHLMYEPEKTYREDWKYSLQFDRPLDLPQYLLRVGLLLVVVQELHLSFHKCWVEICNTPLEVATAAGLLWKNAANLSLSTNTINNTMLVPKLAAMELPLI